MRKRYAYTGERCPVWIPTAFYEGLLDARWFRRFEQLYRSPTSDRIFYFLGWHIANYKVRIANALSKTNTR